MARNHAPTAYWSPLAATQNNLEDYTCRHGMGYTTIGSTYAGIRAETRYFVPLGQNLEIWHSPLPTSASRRRICPYLEHRICLWDGLDDQSNFQRNFNIGQWKSKMKSSTQE